MDLLVNLVMGIFSAALNFVTIIFRIILAFVAAGIAVYKKRNGLFYGVVTFFFPVFIFVMPFIPRKEPKLPETLRNHEAFRGKNPVIASIMALAAMVAKADGSVSKEEIALIKEFLMKRFGVTREILNEYAGAFEYGKNHPEDYMLFANVIREYTANYMEYVRIAYLFMAIGVNDRQMAHDVEVQIRKILLAIGISPYDFERLKNEFTGNTHYSGQNSYGGYSNYGNYNGYEQMNQPSLIKKYSEVLGVSEDASMAEIKKAYRKLAKENHPDKFASEGMPDDYTEFANKKIAEINEAYEYLKKVKEA